MSKISSVNDKVPYNYYTGVCKTSDGSKYWYKNGRYHREDGPAFELWDGDKYWYLNGNLHREDGPACEHANGDKAWYKNDKLHREDGPAIECLDGTKAWYKNGKKYSFEEFFEAATDAGKEVLIWRMDEYR